MSLVYSMSTCMCVYLSLHICNYLPVLTLQRALALKSQVFWITGKLYLLHTYVPVQFSRLLFFVLQVWEAASQAVKDEEAIKQKLCEDLSQLVHIYVKYVFEWLLSVSRPFFDTISLIGSRKQSHTVFQTGGIKKTTRSLEPKQSIHLCSSGQFSCYFYLLYLYTVNGLVGTLWLLIARSF